MPHWRFNPPVWRDADRCVWDRLGGRDALELGICASGFNSSSCTYRVDNPPITVRVQKAVCTYREQGGKRRILGVSESHMTGSTTPAIVIVDIRPAYWTLEWLLWILNPRGDRDTKRHRSSFHVGRLADVTDERLLYMVEDVVGMRVDPW